MIFTPFSQLREWSADEIEWKQSNGIEPIGVPNYRREFRSQRLLERKYLYRRQFK